MKEEKPVVDCNNGWSRAALRLSVLLSPFWLLLSPGYLIYVFGDDYNYWYTQEWMGIPLVVLFPITFVLGSVSSYLTLSNKFSIQKGRIFLPPPRYGSYSADSLVRVSLEKSSDGSTAKAIVLHFELEEKRKASKGTAAKEVVVTSYFDKISLARIPGKKAKQMLKLIESSCSRCVIDDEARNYLLGEHSAQFRSAVETDNKLHIQYHSHERIKNFLALIKSYESYFWKVYLSVCIIPAAALAPLPIWLVPALIQRAQGKSMPSAPHWYTEWFRMFTDGTRDSLRTLEKPGKFYFEIMMHPITVTIMVLLTFYLLYRFIRFLKQPNLLTVDTNGFQLSHQFRNKTLSRSAYEWTEFTKVTLEKPKGTTAAEQWLIAFHGKEKQSKVVLKFSAIKGEGDRERFMSAVEQHAAHLTRDPELIEAFKPAQSQSYTELWLQSLSAPPKRERLAPLTPGQILKSGKYIVKHQLGTGGQGIAYVASDKVRGKSIVVKEFVLPVFVDKAARRQALEKFEKEAVLLQELDHPRVVKLLDYFIEDHRGYLVLEHINGPSLRKLVEDNGPLSEQEVINYAEQMCDILAYLHSLAPPLVHRDFTPDNLILNEDGVLKLIDFNVAHQKESTTKVTVVGKHAYLPPEQFRGKPVPQSDIYAMGASLHYLVTGQDPEPVSVAHPILINEQVSAELNSLIEKCTDLDLKTRYASAEEVQRGLRAITCAEQPGQILNLEEPGMVLQTATLETVLAEEK